MEKEYPISSLILGNTGLKLWKIKFYDAFIIPIFYLIYTYKLIIFQELQAVLDFMYMGEVNVAQEELNSFLAVAEDLRVKG